nr:glycosyl hydrolase family 65 protein [Telluria aromaticivorans]
MRLTGGGLRFAPTLPAKWQRYAFRVHVHGGLLEVTVDAGATGYRLLNGEALAFTHHGAPVALSQAEPFKRMESQ